MRRAWFLGVLLAACGGQPGVVQDPSQPEHKASKQGYAEPPPPPAPPPDPQAKDPVDSAGKERPLAERRDLTTLEGAVAALDADKIQLDALFGGGKATALAAGSSCDVACRALGSMRRSVNAVCELAGAEDSRCVAARTTLSSAEQRVRNAGCGCPSVKE